MPEYKIHERRFGLVTSNERSAPGDQHVGPIIFGHPIARAQLVDHGEVVTFRTSERTTGETWWRETRTGPKRGDVTVRRIGPATSVLDLMDYVELSGFESVEDWQDAIRDVHGEGVDGVLYRATEGHDGE